MSNPSTFEKSAQLLDKAAIEVRAQAIIEQAFESEDPERILSDVVGRIRGNRKPDPVDLRVIDIMTDTITNVQPGAIFSMLFTLKDDGSEPEGFGLGEGQK
jgi:hypothetical protein